MSSFQSDIFDAINDSVAISALIGERFFWDVADGGTPPPYLVAQVVSGDGITDHDGERPVSASLVQFTVWANGKAEAINVIATVKSELEGVALTGSSNTSLLYAGEQSTRDPDTRLFGEILELRAVHTPNQPN